MYVAVKGGERAIQASLALLEKWRRGDKDLPEIAAAQLVSQMGIAVDRVMAEGSLLDPELAALALLQAQGDVLEAVFLLRAFRACLPRLVRSQPLNTNSMTVARRISACFKDIPGGQLLGPSADYSQRILHNQIHSRPVLPTPSEQGISAGQPLARVTDILAAEGLLFSPEEQAQGPHDITRDPLNFPAPRSARLQALSRADEGFALSMAYATQRGYGDTHPFVGEIRAGWVPICVRLCDIDASVTDESEVAIGEIFLTECEMLTQFTVQLTQTEQAPPAFTSGYGLAPGRCERKAMSMALLDRSLRAVELGEPVTAPSQDQEFVLAHADNVEASGFVQHLKLPHHVDFQSELSMVKNLRDIAHRKAPNQDERSE